MNYKDFLGSSVSIEVGGGLGWYQGEVSQINTEMQTITLSKVLHNGRPTAHHNITLNAGDIKNLSIINQTGSDKKEKKKSTNVNLTTAQDSLTQRKSLNTPSNDVPSRPSSSNATNSFSKSGQESPIKRKPRTSVGEILASGSQQRRNNGDQLAYGLGGNQEYGSPRRQFKKYQGKYHPRNDITFGTSLEDEDINTDFDFEKNLALFDKEAVYEEMVSLKPDLVRVAEKRTKKFYHHKENVIPNKQRENQITVPSTGAGDVVYTNDYGLLVPSVTGELRTSILSMANQHGLTNSRQLETIGRGATELILSLIGGSHRLDPGNSHQTPVVAVLCGGHFQGAAGVNTARQLECHGVTTKVITPPLPTTPPPSLLLSHELQLYNLTSGSTSNDVMSLLDNVDLIVDARIDQNGQVLNGSDSFQDWQQMTTDWASNSRASVLALDPPSDLLPLPGSPPLPARIVLCITLPLAYTPARGKVYLLNLPIPLQTFSSVGIKYTPPFGTKLVIPLHPCE